MTDIIQKLSEHELEGFIEGFTQDQECRLDKAYSSKTLNLILSRIEELKASSDDVKKLEEQKDILMLWARLNKIPIKFTMKDVLKESAEDMIDIMRGILTFVFFYMVPVSSGCFLITYFLSPISIHLTAGALTAWVVSTMYIGIVINNYLNKRKHDA